MSPPVSANQRAIEAIERSLEEIDAEWMARREALENALVALRTGTPVKPTLAAKTKTRRLPQHEIDLAVGAYISRFTRFTEAEVAHATNLAHATVQSSLQRFAMDGAVLATDDRENGRGHRRASRAWDRVRDIVIKLDGTPTDVHIEAEGTVRLDG